MQPHRPHAASWGLLPRAPRTLETMQACEQELMHALTPLLQRQLSALHILLACQNE